MHNYKAALCSSRHACFYEHNIQIYIMDINFIIRRDTCCILLVKKISCFACAAVLIKYSAVLNLL